MSSSVWSQLTPEEMAITPAGIPPPGVIPNFIDPPSEGYQLYIARSVIVGIMLVSVGLRFYTGIFIRRRTAADDWTTLIAAILTCIYFIICVISVAIGRYGTHMWDLSMAHTMSDSFIICGFFINWASAIIWPFAKSSFFLMYLELFSVLTWLRYAIYFGLFVNWSFYISILIGTLYFISPAPGQTWQESVVSPRHQKTLTKSVPIAIGSLLLDIYILILPMLGVRGLQIDFRRKLGALAIFATAAMYVLSFSVGVLLSLAGFSVTNTFHTACIASSLSIYFETILDQDIEDFSYYNLPIIITYMVEICVGITCVDRISLIPFSPLVVSATSQKSTTPSPGLSSLWQKQNEPPKKSVITDTLELLHRRKGDRMSSILTAVLRKFEDLRSEEAWTGLQSIDENTPPLASDTA